MTNATTTKEKRTLTETQKNVIETRKRFFETMEKSNVLTIDLGNKAKIIDNRKVLFIANEMQKHEDLFTLKTIQKALMQRIKEAKTNNGNKPRKECDTNDLYFSDLQKQGRIKSGALIGKVELFQAIKRVYLVNKVFYNPQISKDGELIIKKWEYIENLFNEVE